MTEQPSIPLVTELPESGVDPAGPLEALPTAPAERPKDLWDRLKEHKVAQWTLAYAAAAYTLLHGVEMVSDAPDWPHIAVRVVTLLLFVGLPLVATLAWYHGHRAQQRVSGIELVILTVLLVIAGSALWRFARPVENHALAGVAGTAPTGLTIAVPTRLATTNAAATPSAIAVTRAQFGHTPSNAV